MPLHSKAESHSSTINGSLSVPDIADSSLDWHTAGRRSESPDASWQHWLFDPGSLTKLLVQKSGGDFRVEVRAEEWQLLPEPAVRACFGPLSAEHRFWSRKVVLVGRDTPWVLAHTLIPEFSLISPLKQVLELNRKPLGEYLFNHPDLIRSGIDITPMPDESWGRRSLFYLYKKPIMVAEFFLPALLK